MKFEISYWNAYIGKYSNSYKIANELILNGKDEIAVRKAEELKQYLSKLTHQIQ